MINILTNSLFASIIGFVSMFSNNAVELSRDYYDSFWNSMAGEVNVGYKRFQVSRETWSWDIKNMDNYRCLSFLKFTYRDNNGEHVDYLPYTLKPGETHGGWASYTSTGLPTSFTAVETKWKSCQSPSPKGGGL